jgi:hypothetical protein
VDEDRAAMWAELRRMSDDALRAMVLMEPEDAEAVTAEDVRNEIERRERGRAIGQIRALLVVAVLCWIVIAVTLVFLALLAFGVLHPVGLGRF